MRLELTDIERGIVVTALDTEIKRVNKLQDLQESERASWLADLAIIRRKLRR